MANTIAQLRAEAWVVGHFLPEQFRGISFEPKKMELVWKGKFAFDAVSNDGGVVALVSTSAVRTASGKHATAKIQKLKSDALYLLHVKNEGERVMVFCEESMLQHFTKEVDRGRFPPNIKLLYAQLPPDLQKLVNESRKAASMETSPTKDRVSN